MANQNNDETLLKWLKNEIDDDELADHLPKEEVSAYRQIVGEIMLDPDEAELGVDLFDVTGGDLTRILGSSTRPLKARLMDQAQIAGLGNLLTDEILWRASLDPERPADSLGAAERRRLLHHLGRTVRLLLDRGGSHMGDLQDERHPDGRCPRDGALLRRCTVGGRTTYACPDHQRAQD